MTSTTIASVGKQSKSIRTVIPYWIAKMMKLKKGQKIEWEIVSTGRGNNKEYLAKFKVVEE
tara:strand:- start:4248 stop:4430 length:183 start_codon:yes stop_codon:yes gene_type:complete